MIQSFSGNISQIIQSNPWLAFVAVFIGGLLTASNPCVLAMIPLTIGFVGGTREISGLKKALLFSIFFVLGLSVTFTILGLIAVSLGRLFGDIGSFWKYLVAGICLIMGLHLMGIFKFNIKIPHFAKPKVSGLIGAFFLGLLFGVVSSPCATPILAVLLAFIAAKGNLVYGVTLLFFYALGHCALILVAGTSVGAAKNMLASRGLRMSTGILRKVAGALIILVGGYFLFFVNL